ncbi:MAG TPA: hypothetical protein VHP30_11390, partial [Ignavibacteriales bacterium]|nr:hypothetical protein [Ignavibacteriales bacterium]
LLIGIFIFFLFKGEFKRTVFFSLTAFSILFLAHSLYYLYNKDDFFYYFTMLNENFRYAYYDFFPASAAKVFGGSDYFTLLVQQIILNIKYAFLRRHNMGLPLLGIALSIYSIVKKRNVISAYWFAGLSAIFIGFTTSIAIYAPLNLHNSWNLYPLIFPLFLIIAAYAKYLKREILYILCAAYLIGGVYVSYKYKAFFDVENKKELKTFIAQNADTEIYTDHHTKYGVDLIRFYEKGAHILLDEEQVRNIQKDGIVIYNKEVLDELKMQGHKYNITAGKLTQNKFVLVKKFGSFEAYKKI